MTNLTKAHRELFRRSPDECFESLDTLMHHCREQKEQCCDRWQPPQEVMPTADDGPLMLDLGNDEAFQLNDWSFGQLCGLAAR